MRLLHYTNSNELALTKDLVGDDKIPPYAILSHTWDEGQEVTFDDLMKNKERIRQDTTRSTFAHHRLSVMVWTISG